MITALALTVGVAAVLAFTWALLKGAKMGDDFWRTVNREDE